MEKSKYEHKVIYLTMIDVNGLKETNDTKGHTAGDKLLNFVADQLRNSFCYDNIVHLGGDEFLLITYEDPSLILNDMMEKYHIFCYGCHKKEVYATIYNTSKIADSKMYLMKRENKQGRE